MAHISTGVEYALHCLLFLAELPPEAPGASAKDLAELQGIPNDFVAKLFTKLTKAGLVRASEGIRGGFALARPADQISVLAVVDAIDEAKPLFECREIRQRCALFENNPPEWATCGTCSIHAVMLAAEQSMRETLKKHTLADLASRAADKAPDSYRPAVVQWLGTRASNRRGAKA